MGFDASDPGDAVALLVPNILTSWAPAPPHLPLGEVINLPVHNTTDPELLSSSPVFGSSAESSGSSHGIVACC